MVLSKKEKSIEIKDHQIMKELVGNLDKRIDFIKSGLDVEIQLKDNSLMIFGFSDKVDLAENLIKNLVYVIERQRMLDAQDLKYVMEMVKSGRDFDMKDLLNDVVCITASEIGRAHV